ncbi:asparagine synthase-related protein [Streptomyces sp. NPDC021093]|uniref:asparagine synthase-related protein n=1 Tax=Streptomyces sp. NPDC021093 TaxID=3365112 RepID=UPI0037A7C660
MTSEAWFAVLPDAESACIAARLLRPLAAGVVAHHSGRPWLLGSWPPGHVVVASVGDARLAVIGRCPVTVGGLSDRLSRVRDVADVDRATAGLAGSFHTVVSVGGRVSVRGTASGVRRVFYARVGGVTVAASRADRLAVAVGSGVDEGQLALHLLSSPPPYPLGEARGLWQGVDAVPAGSGLLLGPAGRVAVRRWWNTPQPHLPLEQGALEVRKALATAVGSCTAGAGTVSADLSGGMDSTSLCFLAAGGTAGGATGGTAGSATGGTADDGTSGAARLITFRWESVDAANDDAAWAGAAAALLPAAEHVVPERSEAPLWFGGMSSLRTVTDEPGIWVRDSARLVTLARLMTARGSRLHLSGAGGDELFCAPPPYLHDYVRSNPRDSLARVRGQRALQRWPLWPLLRELADRRTFGQWLAAWSGRLTAPAPPGSGTDWGTYLHLPPWATPEAVHVVRRLLHEAAARDPRPLAPQRGQHAALSTTQECGRAARQVDQVTSGLGLPYAVPYLDDGVIEAALSVRVAERAVPGRYKPVLATAMREIVPDALLARSTKGEYSADFHRGLRHHKAALVELFDDSRLAGAGLLDAARLRESLRRPHLSAHVMRSLENTLACERWLRTAPTPRGAPCP